MRIIAGHDDEIAAWAGAQLGVVFQQPFTAFGFLDQAGSVKAAAIFNDYYRGGNVGLTYVGPHSFQKHQLAFLCSFAFDSLKASRVTARTRRSNVQMRKLMPKSGFAFEYTQRRFYGPEKADDALVYVLTRDAAEKWLRFKDKS